MGKVKIGAVGIGRLGATHARNIAHGIPQAELTAVCSRTLSSAQALQQELEVPYAYDNFDDMLEKTELDAVCITTHTRFHPEQILKSLKAGLAVFCDKPMADNYEDSLELAQKIRSSYQNQICMIGYMKRYDPSYAFIKNQIDLGNLGEPILFRGYAVDSKKIMQQTLKYLSDSEGIFFDFFVHDFDLSRWLVNSNWRDNTVSALGDAYLYKEFNQFNDADNATCLAQFENKAMGFYYCGRTAPHGYLMETEIIGTESIFRVGVSSAKNLVEIIDDRGKIIEEYPLFLDRFEQAYLLEMQEFVDCVIENRKPHITIDDALESCRMAHIANQIWQQNISD